MIVQERGGAEFVVAVEEGNDAAVAEEDAVAIESYGEAASLDPSSPIPDFNRGLVLSRGEDPEAARDAFLGASAADEPAVAADALYNLGNLHFDSQEFGPAIESYLKSLDIDPRDGDARRNLELAVRRLEEQQQQQQEQQRQEKDDSGEGEEEQESPSSEPDSTSSDQDEAPPEEPDDSESDQPSPESAPEDRLSREDAERLLNAVQTEELKVLEQLQENDGEPKGGVIHDW